ncbi:MAG: helix-turn-helix domain-containing protein [Bacteroidota bacterium]
MKRISIIVPKGAILGSLEGSRQVFSQVNEFFKAKGLGPAFKVELVGLSKETPVSGGIFTVNTDLVIADVDKTDLIIIPAIDGDLSIALENNKEFIPWIIKQHQSGAEVASLCLGAFLLASTGLLDGKKCATHWLAESAFKQMFPEVTLVTEKIITDENGLYSSGGAFSYLNLILYLIEKYVGREIAVLSAKVFAIDLDRDSQLSFTVFQGQKGHEDEPIKKVQQFIEKNFQDKITIDQLAAMLAIGRRNLERRFKKATSNTIAEYIQRVKVEAAKISLESSRENVNEVMYKVGYTDNKAFRTTFKRLTGLSPIQYRSKYYRQQAV